MFFDLTFTGELLQLGSSDAPVGPVPRGVALLQEDVGDEADD